jgi:hypothetical protein
MNVRRAILTLSVISILAAACAPFTLVDMEPYPCAADGTCPSYDFPPPAFCVAGQCRSSAKADNICAGDVGAVACPGGASCAFGVCPGACGDGKHVSVDVGCLVDCTSTGTCPNGLTCIDYVDGLAGGINPGSLRKICVAPADAAMRDTPCGSNDCSVANGYTQSSYQCHAGACVLPCSYSEVELPDQSGPAVCPAGRLCALDPGSKFPSGGAGCLTDCTNGTACPGGLTCASVAGVTGKVCTGG